MTEHPDKPGQEPLSYRAAADDAPTRRRQNMVRLGGILSGAAYVWGVAFIWIITSIGDGRPMYGLVAAVVGAAVVFGISRAAKTDARKIFWQATLIGIGIGVLVEGGCFALLLGR
ncbi:MAG TPA: hypothetical protein VIL86_04305 [Tepidisphaeraceae bacterium]